MTAMATELLDPVHPLLDPAVRRLDAATLVRRAVVDPGMCGPTSLLAGRFGDWTWAAVSALCGTDVFAARNAEGEPAYLAFYYLHLSATPALHPGSLGFGDRVEVVSRPYDLGSESILTVHRLRRDPGDGSGPPPLAAGEPHAPRAGCLYVESFNRWVSRSRADSNRELVRSSPPGFRHRHLPALPERWSPRLACRAARGGAGFRAPRPDDRPLGEHRLDYAIDPTRDVNAVGLVYFAAYFAIVERAILGLWRRLGRSDRDFLGRVALDSKLCFLGNAEIDSVLAVRVRALAAAGRPPREVFDIVIEDPTGPRTVAVATVELLAGGDDERS